MERANSFTNGESPMSVHTTDYSTLLWPVVNFSIYLAIFIYLYRKHVPQRLRARSIEIAEQLQRAAHSIHQAEHEFELLDRRMKQIEAEKSDLTAKLANETDSLIKVIQAEARGRVERLLKDNARQIDTELRAAEKELRRETALVALDAARDRLKRDLSGEIDRRLRQEVLQPGLFH